MADAEAIKLISERAVTMRAADAPTAAAIASSLRALGLFEDVVPGPDSISASFDPRRCSLADACSALQLVAVNIQVPTDLDDAKLVELPTTYGGEAGPDLLTVAKARGLMPDEVIARHSAQTYAVEVLGFVPGFAYLSGLDPTLDSERLARPRLRVEAGSVGISGRHTGVYSLAGPGGWPILGRTTHPLVDPDADEPFLLKPGMRVKFVPR